MKYEFIKSIILVFLIVASAFLTWSLWTFKPNVQLSEQRYVHDIAIAQQVETSQIIKPTKALFHFQNDHYGTVKDEDLDMLIYEISTWNFYDVSSARVLTEHKQRQLFQSDGRIEIRYPDLVPFDLYKGVIQIEMDVMPGAAFDRIVIQEPDRNDGAASVFFVNTKESRVYETHVNLERMNSLIQSTRNNLGQYDKQIEYELPGGRIAFIPENAPEMSAPQYVFNTINPERFKYALFRDPTKVRTDLIPNGAQYVDNISKMDVNYTSNMIFYVNPGQEPTSELIDEDIQLLKNSIDFINEHGGWTDEYRYAKAEEFQRQTVFRLHVNGYPVFNEQGATELRQYWGNDEIYMYQRPYFSLDLDVPLPPVQRKVVLPKAEEALVYLQEHPSYNMELIEDIVVGYKLSKNIENQQIVYVLEPSWYCLFAGSWLRLDSQEIREGINYGLEPN